MKKIVLLLMVLCWHEVGYASGKSCFESFGDCPIDPSKETHFVHDAGQGKYIEVIGGSPDAKALPFAFAMPDKRNSYKYFLKVSDNKCYAGDIKKCFTKDLIGIIRDGRIVDFYKYKQVSADYGIIYNSSGFFRLKDSDLNKIKQCAVSNSFPLENMPSKHGFKAYKIDEGKYPYGYDKGNNIFHDGNGVLIKTSDLKNACFYYVCEDGYMVGGGNKKGVCLNKEKYNLAKEKINELQKLVNEANDLTQEQKTALVEKINSIKSTYGMQ